MISIAVLFSLLTFHTFSQPFTKDDKQILQLQDKRSIVSEQVYDMTDEGSNETKIAALLYFANTGDSNSALYIDKILGNTNSNEVKIWGFFALGQIPCTGSVKILNKYFSGESNPEIKASVIDALSRIGSTEDLNTVLSISPGNEKLNSALAMAITRFGLRKIKNDKAYIKLSELMESSVDSLTRRNIIYAFNRTADQQTLKAFNTELMISSTSPEPYTRMWGFSALGKELDTSFIPYFLESLEKETDWRVKVNILNAIGNLKVDQNTKNYDNLIVILFIQANNSQSDHVILSSLQAISKLSAGFDKNSNLGQNLKRELKTLFEPGKAVDWQIKTEAIRTYAKIFRDDVKGELFSLFNSSDNYDIKSAIVGAFGSMNDPMVYKELRDSISNDVQRYNVLHPNKDGSMIGSPDLAKLYRAFVDALTELDDKLDAENRNIIRLILSEFSSSKDPLLTDNCLTNLQDSMYLQYRNETCQIMTFDYQGFVLPKDRDVALMYLQAWDNMKYDGAKEILTGNLKSNDYDIAIASANALKNITGKSYEKEITAPKYRTDYDWSFIDKLDEKKFAVIKTNRGEIKIELFANIAPFTVQNFVKLAEKGYYNNTIFHRVVPNFVIQGGDPTGTGYGGPGYSIRSEFSPLSFDAYTVGMASSGKDTEGSQFFITHSPQPHLDGKYTLFGKVIEGFEVVDNIQIGDVIESVSFSALK